MSKPPTARPSTALPRVSRPDELRAWLGAHRRTVIATLLALAAIVRIGHFVEASRGPGVVQHEVQNTDMSFFHHWAGIVADGDWATNRALHPVHEWHREIAGRHFAAHPDELDAFATAGGGDAARGLWDHWYGGERFHQEPVYPYLVAVTSRIFGSDVRWVFLGQMVLGIAIVGLVFVITWRLLGETEAVVAGLLAALCGPLVFYEMVLLRATLITFTGLLLVLLVSIATERDTWRWWLGAGCALGLAALVKMTFGLFALGVVAWVVLSRARRPRAVAVPAGALALGIAIGLAPAAGRNVAVGVAPLAMSSVNAITFIQANAEDYPPARGFHDALKHSPRIMAETDGRFGSTVRATLRTHPSAGSYLGQLGGKLASMWHGYEKPNNVNLYYARLHSNVLRTLPVTFHVIGPLGFLGLLLAIPRVRALWPLLGMLATLIVAMLLSYVLSRFRVPMMVALIPFAAFAIVRVVEWTLEARLALVSVAALVLALGAVATWRPRPEGQPLVRMADHAAAFQSYYGPRAEEAGNAGDWARAAAVFAQMLRTEPTPLAGLSAARPAQGAEQVQLAAAFSDIRFLHADALERSGDAVSAGRERERATALAAAARQGRP